MSRGGEKSQEDDLQIVEKEDSMETSQETRREIPDIQSSRKCRKRKKAKEEKEARLIQKNNRTANRKEKQSEIEKEQINMRIGMGYDVHKLVEGRKLILGGVEIPNEKGLLGHSDADVLLHAIMDALLGAAALGDIGKHFPDTDPAYKGISSIRLLEHVADLLEEHQFLIENIDATIIAQRPKMRPYIDTMRENIAKALKIESDQINVKATTEEGLGFTGSGEGISSQAICMLEKVMNYSSVDVTAQTGGCAGCQGCKKA